MANVRKNALFHCVKLGVGAHGLGFLFDLLVWPGDTHYRPQICPGTSGEEARMS